MIDSAMFCIVALIKTAITISFLVWLKQSPTYAEMVILYYVIYISMKQGKSS